MVRQKCRNVPRLLCSSRSNYHQTSRIPHTRSLSLAATMAFPSAFQERLRQMEKTRHQRISHLQAEKEHQSKKSELLSSKLRNIRIMEQRCLMLEHQNAVLNFKILSHRSEIEQIETKYNEFSQEFRVLKREVEEVEESEKEKDDFYGAKVCEMERFKEKVERRVLELRQQVLERRKNIDELKSSLQEIQGNKDYMSNSEIGAAEMEKAQLVSVKESLDMTLASNYQLRAQLQKQLYNILKSQVRREDTQASKRPT